MGDVSLNRSVKAEPAAGGCAQENQSLDTMSAGWTDERHMRYISSMEASFVDQLHNHGHHSHYRTGCGFKVLRGGVWEYINYEKSIDCAQSRTKYSLPANPWIKHFRPRHCSSNVKGDGLQDSEGDYESDTQTNRKRISVSHGGKEEACNAEKQLRVERTEVSDQNFADDELEVDAESSKRSKKTRVCSTETLNDQVNSDAESA